MRLAPRWTFAATGRASGRAPVGKCTGARVANAFNTLAMESFDAEPSALCDARAQIFARATMPKPRGKWQLLPVILDLRRSIWAAVRPHSVLGDIIRLLIIDGGQGSRAHLRLDVLPKSALGSINVHTSGST